MSLAGPDGIGKSTTINELQKNEANLGNLAKAIIVKNWRPHILPRLGRFVGKPKAVDGIGENNIILPRSKHGRLQVIRVVYYWIDFVLGHYLEDKINSSKLRLIIYDRSIYDSLINPERFGLKNGLLTKLLVRYSPKPDILFYLSDSADRIYARKPELSINEIKRQQKKWIELFLIKKNTIDLIVEINYSPEVIAEFIKYAYLRLWKQKFYPSQFYADYLMANYSSTQKYAKPDNSEKIFKLSFEDGRIYYIPTKNFKVYKTALSLYEAHSRKGQILKNILLLLFPFTKLLASRKENERNLTNHYSLIIALIQDLCFSTFGNIINWAISLGAPGPFQKPVVKAIGESGKVFCYIKIGINRKTIEAVKNEAKWLNELNYLINKGIEVPKIIFSQENDNNYFFAQSAYEEVNGYKTETKLIKYLRHFQTINQEKMKRGKFLYSQLGLLFTARINEITQEYLRNTLSHYFNRICTKINDNEIIFSINHGDFTPWNCRFLGEKIYLFDWEYCDDIHPVGWDMIRFLVQTSLHIDKINMLDLCKRFKIGGDYFVEVKKFMKGFGQDNDNLIISIIELYIFEQVLNTSYYDSNNIKKLSDNLTMLFIYCNLIDELNL